MRSILLAAILIALPLAQAELSSQEFGAPGVPAFAQYAGDASTPVNPPGNTLGLVLGNPIEGCGEPTIGIPWNTDHVFMQCYATTYKIVFQGNSTSWSDVTPPYQVPLNLDPMIEVDPDSGRILAGGLHAGCSIMMFSDDDGNTWLPTVNMCSGEDFDHQTIGLGPAAGPIPSTGLNAYYCGQGGTISCAASYTGGVVFAPWQTHLGSCGGFHGHIRISRVDGFVGLPVPDCGDQHGLIHTADGGVLWNQALVEGSHAWDGGFDPSLQFGRGEGWMYYGMADAKGIFVSMSKDNGATWEGLGSGHGHNDTWLEIGQFHDPAIVAGTFADVQVGDDDRVAFTFMGLEDKNGDGTADEYPEQEHAIYSCDERQEEMIWYYFAAFSYDAGQTWEIHKMSDDPVQVGGVYDSVTGSGGGCRNLLDFNDMDIDSTGRIYVGFADGCIDACAETPHPDSSGYRAAFATIIRQETGRGLFAEFDVPGPEPTPAPVVDESDDKDTSALPLVAALAALGAAVYVRRR